MPTQPPLNFEGIERLSLKAFTEKAYLEYSMHVILDRALPHIGDGLKPGQEVQIRAVRKDGSETVFTTTCRLDTPVEVEYYRNGGILHTVLINFLKGEQAREA